jgi:hypothetical protein
MKDICKNAQNFAATARGQNLHPNSGIANDVYGYDLDTGETVPKSRQEYRRDASCPGTWKSNHPCPKTDRRDVMRHDGSWYTKAIEPGTDSNKLMDLYDAQGNVAKYSNVWYTCDEFPPATWVEGGGGPPLAPLLPTLDALRFHAQLTASQTQSKTKQNRICKSQLPISSFYIQI